MPVVSVGALSVDDLLKAFKEDAVSANKTFVGKTVLVQGLIGELIKDGAERARETAKENADAWYRYRPQYASSPRNFKKVLLVSEQSLDGWSREGLPLTREPVPGIEPYEKLQFEGVYCEFDGDFQPYRGADRRFPKRELLLKCKIKGFESGVITSDGYRNKGYPSDYVGAEKKRIIAVNCSELGFLEGRGR